MYKENNKISAVYPIYYFLLQIQQSIINCVPNIRSAITTFPLIMAMF